VDFGAQYAQLIARRVREARVYSEIVPHTMPVDELLAKQPAAIILSGGPSSVYAEGAPSVPTALFTTGVPTFGICYGFQAMASALGGRVERTGQAEFGGTPLEVVAGESTLFHGLPRQQSVWMSHGDAVTDAPPGFAVVARSPGRRSRRSRTPSVASPACSSTRRCSTASTARPCSSTSSTSSPGSDRPGR
jgi:GMP synthase (glutamine-hydrolysing)